MISGIVTRGFIVDIGLVITAGLAFGTNVQLPAIKTAQATLLQPGHYVALIVQPGVYAAVEVQS